jgi:ATP:ADP antiporter, AAA family
VLYVIIRSAKFSLFKPAEEMVYLSLDARARLNGKAAVDVLGAQFGKSSGSMLQQLLLVFTAGSALHSLPVMFIVFLFVAVKWGTSVDTLSRMVPSHTSLDSVDLEEGGGDKYQISGQAVDNEELEKLWQMSGAGSLMGLGGKKGPHGCIVQLNARWRGSRLLAHNNTWVPQGGIYLKE